jgi:hypothetical protein
VESPDYDSYETRGALVAYTARAMNLSDASSPLKQLGKTPWKFQRTLRTPVRNIPPFVSTILASVPSLQAARVTIETTAFEPEHLLDLLTRHSLPRQYKKGTSVLAEGQREIEELVCAVFSDWMDFLLVPTPKPFVIYADHDEYATFYANTRSNLNRVTDALLAEGIEEVSGYQRQGLR